MSIKTTAVAATMAVLLASATMGHAQTRTTTQTPYTVPGTNLRVNHAPYRIDRFGGTTVYQFNRRRTGFTWPNAYPCQSTYTYAPYYTYPYSYPASPYYGYP